MNAKDERPDHFEPLTPEEEIIERLNSDLPKDAANLIRKLHSPNRLLLDAFADMLGGDPTMNPEVAVQYTYRLQLASWGKKGPKPRGSRVKAKNNRGYRKKGERRPVSEAMLTSKVNRHIEAGLSRKAAIAQVAKSTGYSASAVEKAFDRKKRLIKISRSNPSS